MPRNNMTTTKSSPAFIRVGRPAMFNKIHSRVGAGVGEESRR
jgi:hypothetical protein